MKKSSNSRHMLPKTLPSPKRGRGGTLKAAIWAMLAMLALGGSVGWLTLDEEDKEALRDSAACKVNDAAAGTPLAGVGDMLRKSPPPPPEQVLNPPTAAGTLSGRNVTGTIAAPVEMGSQASYSRSFEEPGKNAGRPGASDQPAPAEGRLVPEQTLIPGVGGGPDGTTFTPKYMPPVKEDTKVRPTYLSDLAQWLAHRYQPGPRGGTLSVDARNMNQLWGVELAARAEGGRQALLRYAFQPSMIQGLYDLYINQFMRDLDNAANERGLNASQNRDFHMAVAGKATLAANALDGIMAVPDLGKRLNAIDEAAQKAVDINAQLANAVFDLDELREDKAATAQQLSAGQMRVDGITARYRRAMDDHAAARQALVDDIRKNCDNAPDSDSLLFMASWVERRMGEGQSARDSVKGVSGVLRDLARRCAQAVRGGNEGAKGGHASF